MQQRNSHKGQQIHQPKNHQQLGQSEHSKFEQRNRLQLSALAVCYSTQVNPHTQQLECTPLSYLISVLTSHSDNLMLVTRRLGSTVTQRPTVYLNRALHTLLYDLSTSKLDATVYLKSLTSENTSNTTGSSVVNFLWSFIAQALFCTSIAWSLWCLLL